MNPNVNRIGWMLAAVLALLGCRAPDDGRVEAAERRVAELERENSELRTRLEIAALHQHEHAVPVCPSFPPIEATVLEVNRELRWVRLDKGAADGVRLGFDFVVYRGSVFRGLVRVDSVQERCCTGLLIGGKSPIEVGDDATTTL